MTATCAQVSLCRCYKNNCNAVCVCLLLCLSCVRCPSMCLLLKSSSDVKECFVPVIGVNVLENTRYSEKKRKKNCNFENFTQFFFSVSILVSFSA